MRCSTACFRPPEARVLRSAILAAADSPRLRGFVDRYGMQLGAARFVGGETLDEVVVTLRRLNEQGLRTNTTLLGELVGDPAEAERITSTYEEVLRRIAAEELRTNVAVKPTHLGAVLDEEVAYANIERLVVEAGRLGNFVRIDMEDSSTRRCGPTAASVKLGTTTSAPSSRRTCTAHPRTSSRCFRCNRTCGS
jgi:proline dehydrogenase